MDLGISAALLVAFLVLTGIGLWRVSAQGRGALEESDSAGGEVDVQDD